MSIASWVMMDDEKYGDYSENRLMLAFVGRIFLGIACVILVVGGIVVSRDVVQCHNLGSNIEAQTKWTFLNGCFVRDGNRMIPYDRWVNVHGVGK